MPSEYFKIFVNNTEILTDIKPVIKNNRTFIPARTLMESLGAQVIWEHDSKTIKIQKSDFSLILKINSNKAYLNNIETALIDPPFILKDRALLPLRFISEALGTTVTYDSQTRTIRITK